MIILIITINAGIKQYRYSGLDVICCYDESKYNKTRYRKYYGH